MLLGQVTTDQPITDLAARRVQAKVSLSSAMVGLGSTASLMGESVVWPKSDASCLTWNPAALGLLEKRSFVIDWAPSISQDIADYVDVDGPIRDAMDDIVEEEGTSESSVIYPAISPKVGLTSNIGGFGVAVPLQLGERKAGIGIGYTSPLNLGVELLGTGIEAGLDTEQDIQGEMRRIRMRVWAQLDAMLDVKVHQFIIGGGIALSNDFAIGASLSRYLLDARGKAFANIDGIVEMSGNEYVFNDPTDPAIDFNGGEQNTLHQTLGAEYSGSGWGLKFGLVKKMSENFQVGVTVSLPPSLTVHGVDSTVTNEIPFLVFENDDDEEDDLIDPEEINLAKLTLTQRQVEINRRSIVLNFPKAYSVGFVYQSGIFSFTMRYTYFSGGLTSDIYDNEIRGLSLKHGVGIGLDFKYFFFGASAMVGDEVRPLDKVSDSGDPLTNVPLPRAHVGIRIPTFKDLWVDGLVSVEPTPMVRLSIRHHF